MAQVIYVTGNPNKARYFEEIIGQHVGHQAAHVPELQSLDLLEVVEHKVRGAYEQIKQPVIVEDTSLSINSMGRLPGPLVKWFIDELGLEKICRLADISDDRSAVASAAFAYFDGQNLHTFKSELHGTIPQNPIGDEGYGWNPIFIPEGQSLTMGQMDDNTFKKFYTMVKPFDQVREFLERLGGGDAGSRTPDLGNANAAL